MKLLKCTLPKAKESKKSKDIGSKQWALTGDRVEETSNTFVKEGPKRTAV